MQSASWEMLDCMKHKLESKLPWEISVISDTQVTAPLQQKAKKNRRASWWKWKAGLKLNIQKTKIMASGLITSWQIDGETVSDFILGGSKIIADMIAAIKLKDAYSLEGKLWPT